MKTGEKGEISVLADHADDGTPVFEQLPAKCVGLDTYLLLASPALVLGIASGDVITLDSDAKSTVVKRGGNIVVHVYGPHERTKSLVAGVTTLGGELDGWRESITVLTVPSQAGFVAIENALNQHVSNEPKLQWYYGNVYDPEDGVTPLNWWLRS